MEDKKIPSKDLAEEIFVLIETIELILTKKNLEGKDGEEEFSASSSDRD